MSYIPPEIVEKAQKIDLLTYLKNNEPDELVHISGENYCTKSHDSLKISNGLWNWFSKGIGGKNAIDYLIKVKNYSFTEAVEILMNGKIITPISENFETKEQKKDIIVPKKSNDFSIVKSYLMNRGIDENIIEECYKSQIIYQEDKTNNVVFVGYDDNKNIKYIGIRATNETRFMRDGAGSNKAFSFRMLSKNSNNSVHIFESSIDLLSYATLLKLKNIDYKNENLIALSGVYQPAKIVENSKMPITISEFLNKNQHIENIFLHFDNDMAGRNATKAIQIIAPKNYKIIDKPVPRGKDVNDYLCYKLGLKKLKNKEFVR